MFNSCRIQRCRGLCFMNNFLYPGLNIEVIDRKGFFIISIKSGIVAIRL